MTWLAWAENLPHGWRAVPLRSVADYAVSNVDKLASDDELPVRLCNYTDVYKHEFITPDLELMSATATVDEVEKFGLRRNDVIITKDSEAWDDIGVPALIHESADDLVCGYHLALIRPRADDLDGEFLFRCLQSKPVRVQLELAANGITRFGIPKSAIGSMAIPVGPLPTQQAIAQFLRQETARLDALIAAKERMLRLLAEKRRALITRAVTRGIDPDARLRDSDIAGLGKVPAHWETLHLRRVLASSDYGISDAVQPDGVVAVLRMGDVKDGEIDFAHVGFVNECDPYLMLQKGDLLFNRTNSLEQIGKVGLMRNQSDTPVSFASYLVRMRCSDRIIPEYLNYFLNSTYALAWARAEALPAIGQANLNPNRYSYLRICLPPIMEQQEVVSYIDSESARLTALRDVTERSISLLRERRAALIAAAVTGQLPIPELTEPVPSTEEEMACSSTA